jgi:hypothetical protein
MNTNCKRCNGTGHLPQYRHHQGGECFTCRGERPSRDVADAFAAAATKRAADEAAFAAALAVITPQQAAANAGLDWDAIGPAGQAFFTAQVAAIR